MPTIVLTTHGTAGDIFPFVRIGQALKQRGHAVTLITHSVYAALARQAGLDVAALDTPAEYQQLLDDQYLLRNPLARPDDLRRFYQRNNVFAKTRREFELIGRCVRGGPTLLITRYASGLAGLLAAEVLGLPLINLVPSPYQFAAALAGQELYRDVLGDGINALRAELSLAPVQRWYAWFNSAQRHIGLWPAWFATSDEAWPAGTVPVGFVLGDEAGQLPAALQHLPGREAALVLISGGSSTLIPEAFYRVAAGACGLLGRRAILACRHAQLLPAELPSMVEHYSALPFASLMPAMGAVIHHGGIGTAGRALASATPQLILPSVTDGPDNAARLVRLGVAQTLPPRDWQTERVAAALAALLASPHVRERCQQLQAQLEHADPVATVCDIAEAQLAAGPVRAHQAPRDDLSERLRALSPKQQAALAERLKRRASR
jgi:UDP:flavonoid glycosyltransferase YjiC (YdhE family)